MKKKGLSTIIPFFRGVKIIVGVGHWPPKCESIKRGRPMNRPSTERKKG